jgi:hypothetical protein
MAAHHLAEAPPNAIAHHRPAKRLLDTETKTALRQIVDAEKNSEVGTRTALSGAVNSVKFSAPHQPRFARKFQAPCLTRA